MSLQELGITEKTLETTVTNISPSMVNMSRTDWFKKKYPHFFTDKVTAHRNQGMQKTVSVELPSWIMVDRKVGQSNHSHIALHVDRKNKSFYFRCPCNTDVRMHIKTTTLQIATVAVQGSKWVTIKFGAETLTLKRTSLRTAFQTLEA